MQWSDVNFTPPTRTLRQFAGLWLVFFGGMAGFQWLVRERPVVALVIAVLAVSIGLAGLLKPALIRPIYVGAMIATFPIGFVVSKVLLGLMFFGIFTPVALIFRLIGRDALALRPQLGVESYWIEKRAAADPRSYFRPF